MTPAPRSPAPSRASRGRAKASAPAGERAGAAADPPPTVAAAAAGGPVAGLAASQLKRIRRIVDAAVQLAEQGGFDGVRLRDVAEASDVALGTLYKYFRSKEDILLFALNEEVRRLEAVLSAHAVAGDTPLARVESLFDRATRGLTRRPHLARAILRSISAGDSDLAVQIAGFHLRMTRLIVATLRGEAPDLTGPATAAPVGTERERGIAFVLMNFWFASLSGWAGGLHSVKTVSEQVRTAASLLLGGS